MKTITFDYPHLLKVPLPVEDIIEQSLPVVNIESTETNNVYKITLHLQDTNEELSCVLAFGIFVGLLISTKLIRKQ